MLDQLNQLSGSILAGGLSPGRVLICLACSLVFGLCTALIHRAGGRSSRNFTLTLALLPLIVQIIVMLVNGNLGAGVAVAGTFSLVRFRSIPGNSRDITAVFFCMALGFVAGMGYLFYGFLFLLVAGGGSLLLGSSPLARGGRNRRILRITIPENLDYDGLFDQVFGDYTTGAELDQVKTTNMGSLYELTYTIHLREAEAPKCFLDALRTLNGNLNIILSREHRENEEL